MNNKRQRVKADLLKQDFSTFKLSSQSQSNKIDDVVDFEEMSGDEFEKHGGNKKELYNFFGAGNCFNLPSSPN